MAKRKLTRFKEIGGFDNVVELEAGLAFKGKRATDFFKNNADEHGWNFVV